ncbi:hypothetical protein HELRODRAFT_180234 [Helobdella robusta]|uniref:Uncharacterized protein n=1 Tax=Helobdella robusta TaxID=6412 RepID=T1FFL5_HELRO|nr:hypothetical protein HELRODRAFT_180234 [Helobdella robusta]ESN94067.1 hypothetical protein HELRODRAFT_180234 [Helobdella robusta]
MSYNPNDTLSTNSTDTIASFQIKGNKNKDDTEERDGPNNKRNKNRKDVDIGGLVITSGSLREHRFNTSKKFRIKRIWKQYKRNDSEEEDIYLLEANLLKSLDEISIIGVKHTMDTNRSLMNRTMWALLVFAAFCLAIYQIKERISHYLAYPTLTELDIVQSVSMPFPQVTICNNNYIKMSAAEKLDNFQKIIETSTEKCFWSKKPCSKETISTTFTNEGQCIVINPRKSLNFGNTAGVSMGLHLFLFANQSDYFVPNGYSVGFKVLVHEPNEPARMSELGFMVSLGDEVNIPIYVNEIGRLKFPHGTCTDQPNYHPIKCERTCATREIVKKCNCRPIYLEEIGNETICDYYKETICAEVVMNEYNSNKPDISCPCPPLCNEITYQTSVSGSKLSEQFITAISKLMKEVPKIWTANDLVFLKIYFSSMQYTRVENVAEYSVMSLLCDLGGALGLLLGSTFLTVFEIFELIWDLVVYFVVKMKEKYRNKMVWVVKRF